jgi:hypothetical protein
MAEQHLHRDEIAIVVDQIAGDGASEFVGQKDELHDCALTLTYSTMTRFASSMCQHGGVLA